MGLKQPLKARFPKNFYALNKAVINSGVWFSNIMANFQGKYKPLEYSLLKTYNSQRAHGPKRLICYAPFTNLFFNTAGAGLICCNNTKVVLGTYPEKTIAKMWFGSERKELCKHIEKSDLNNGCTYCAYMIKTGKTRDIKAAANDMYAARKFNNYPKILEFELSNICNLECIMCSGRVSSGIRLNKEKQSEQKNPYDNTFIEQLIPFIKHAEEARFFGGEPFLIPIYYKIWDSIMAHNPSINIYILSNGTIYNEKVKHLLEKGNVNISFSIDAFTKETFEEIREKADFDTIMSNIKSINELYKAKGKPIGFCITPMRPNWKEIPDIIHLANELNALVYFNFLEYPANLALWNLEKEALKKIKDQFTTCDLPAKTENEKKNQEAFKQFYGQIDVWIKQDKHSINPVRNKERHVLSEKANIDYYKKELYQKISDFCKNSTDKDFNTEEALAIVFEKINQLINDFGDENVQLNLLMELNNMPINKMMIQELLTLSPEKLKEITKNMLLDDTQ